MSSNSPTTSSDPSRVLAEAWHRYADAVAARLDVLEEAAAALGRGRLDDALRAQATTEAHRLAGSLGLFGIPEGSRLALACEEALGSDAPLGRADGARIARLALGIRREVEATSSPACG
jgi:HPt (histidine-containing phosphotransfer) domain-containing protein